MRKRWLILLYAKQPRNKPNSTCASLTSRKALQTSFNAFSFFCTKSVVNSAVPIGAPSNFTPALSILSTSAGKGSPSARLGHQISFFFERGTVLDEKLKPTKHILHIANDRAVVQVPHAQVELGEQLLDSLSQRVQYEGEKKWAPCWTPAMLRRRESPKNRWAGWE